MDKNIQKQNENIINENIQVIESIVVDLNSLIKEALDGQYIQCCASVIAISQKLLNIKNSIARINENLDEAIKEGSDNDGSA